MLITVDKFVNFSCIVNSILDENSGEYNCNFCGGCFVELPNQGLDSYLRATRNTMPRERANNNVANGNHATTRIPVYDVMQRILGRTLGVNYDQNRPVAIVLRQGGGPSGLGLLSNSLSGQNSNYESNPSFGGNRSFDDLLHHLMMTENSHASHPASELVVSSLDKRIVDINTGTSYIT